MDLEKAAKRISSLKSYNPNHEWSSQDHLLHRRMKKARDQEANIMFRKNVIDSQKRVNYVNEFDRLKGHLYTNKLTMLEPTREYIKKRQKRLQELASRSLDRKDNLYKDSVD